MKARGLMVISFAVFALPGLAEQAAEATANDPVYVDTTGALVSDADSIRVACEARWTLGSGEDATGVETQLLKIEPAGAPALDPDAVLSVAGDAAASYCWSIGEAGVRTARFVLVSYKDGVQVGEKLTKDIAFGPSGTADATSVDTRENSLDLVFAAGGEIPLAYDSKWTEDSDRVVLEYSQVDEEGLFSEWKTIYAGGSGSGVFPWEGVGERKGKRETAFRVRCRFTEDDLAFYTADYFAHLPKGIVIFVR